MADRVLPTPAEMIAYLDRYVIGQVRAKRDIAVAVYNHYLSQAYREREGVDLGRHHILLIGPTGVGKTYIVKRLAEFLGVPAGFTSAAGLVEAGYAGASVETVVSSVIERAEGDPRMAEKGIVFIDEIDKVRRAPVSMRDVSGEGVQNALLTLLDGRISRGGDRETQPQLDTGRLLFICTGAFVGLKDIIERRLGRARHRVGFAALVDEEIETIADRPTYEILCQVQTADLVEFGLIPEFVGRFATVSVLHELSAGDLERVARGDVDRSPLEIQKTLAALHGIELEITEDALRAIVEEAAALGTGARGLHRLIGRAVDAVDYRWPDLAEQGVAQVVIDEECALGAGEPRLRKGPPVSTPRAPELRRAALAGLPRRPSPSMDEPIARQIEPGITDTRGWSAERIWGRLEELKKESLGWDETKGTPREWWTAFENENRSQPALVLRLAEELVKRDATIVDLFRAYLYSNTDNVQANLHYMDYVRQRDESKKKSDGS